MEPEEAAMILWGVWFENSHGLDFDTWMDGYGEVEAKKIAERKETT